MDQSQSRSEDAREDDQSAPRLDPSQVFGCSAGRIVKGMAVVDADDRLLGYVDSVEGELIRLFEGAAGHAPGGSVPLSLIDGIYDGRILLAGRGDSTFGLGAQP